MTSATAKSQQQPIVFVVDDDISVRESLESLIAFAGWQPETFASAGEFLARPRSTLPSCLVLDVSLPDLDGLELQKLIASERTDMPIIFITGHGWAGNSCGPLLRRRGHHRSGYQSKSCWVRVHHHLRHRA